MSLLCCRYGRQRWAKATAPGTKQRHTYLIEGQTAPHGSGCDPVQHRRTRHCTAHLSGDIEEGTEEGYLRADQVGEGDGGVDVAPADVTDGLDDGGPRQAEAEGHAQHVVRPADEARCSTHADEHEEHGAEEFGEDLPPEGHRAELPHSRRVSGVAPKKTRRLEQVATEQTSQDGGKQEISNSPESWRGEID